MTMKRKNISCTHRMTQKRHEKLSQHGALGIKIRPAHVRVKELRRITPDWYAILEIQCNKN